MNRVLLVVPPFQSTSTPALGVSQLEANLEAAGYPTTVLYLNLRFAERIGFSVYECISQRTTTLLGDFIFSYLLFDRAEGDLQQYLDGLLAEDPIAPLLMRELPGLSLQQVVERLIEAATEWIDDAVAMILEHDPWLVGFSSTFQQNCASLALMRRIKAKRPAVITAMGGANCEGEMGEELFAQFPEIDHLGQGECDHSFVELVSALRAAGLESSAAGFLSRAPRAEVQRPSPLRSEDLEKQPYPDFDDYFAQLAEVGLGDRLLPALVMETSRGCWWGAKQHCTFCGLNAEGMTYRSKSGPRALAEMKALVERYGVDRISVVDNILDMKYFKTALPELIERPIADLFYEVKANLSKAQVASLARARVTWIQPGIESLSDRSLSLMGKGVSELQNVQLLKWCSEVGVFVAWNHLFGVPGEDEAELERIAHDAEALHHLTPPFNTGVLHMDRFSPYFDAPGEYGLEPVSPARPYHHVYPFSDPELRRLAYFYDSEYFMAKERSEGFATLTAIVERWRRLHNRAHLLALPRSKSLTLIDTRPCARRLWRRLTGIPMEVYQHCDKAESVASILKMLGPRGDQAEVEAILRGFVEEKLMLEVNGRYLSLATDARGAYREFAEVPPVGAARPLRLAEELREITRGRTPLGIGRQVARRSIAACRAAATRAETRALRLLVRLHCGRQREEPS